MSDATTHAEHKLERISFISVRHGTHCVSIIIYDSSRDIDHMGHELTPDEARLLADDLWQRAEEIDSNAGRDK